MSVGKTCGNEKQRPNRNSSHSHNHLVPTCISLPEALQEKVISKDILEKGLGERVVSYAYPYGAINHR